MSATDHTKYYSATDIQRYLAGEMSPVDMHALELAALDDPFLADAIEGMQQSLVKKDKAPIDIHLQALRQQLQERVAGKDERSQSAPVIAFRWWQAAAAAAVIVVGSIWAFNAIQNSPSASKKVAMVQTHEKNSAENALAAADSVAVSHNTAHDSLHYKAKSAEEEQISHTEAMHSHRAAKGSDAVLSDRSANKEVALQRTHAPLPTPAAAEAEAKTFKQEDELVVVEKTHQPAATRNSLPYQPVVADSIGAALAVKKNMAIQRNQTTANQFNNTSRDFEQIVVTKTPRDTSAAGYLSKPRELTMNMSRKELSARQAKKNPDALLSGFVSGRVTDNATNSPISNAMVRIEGKRDYFTDNKGWFQIPITDSVVNVAVGTSGYYTQNLRLNNNTSNVISLNQLGDKAPNPVLNKLEGRVAGIQVGQRELSADSTSLAVQLGKDYFNYAFTTDTIQTADFKTLSRRSKANPLAQNAEPEYGWVKYQQYLDQNKRVPANGTAGAGKVVVAFEIDKKGIPTNLTVISSPGQVYADEAIRLIKAGPSWKLLKGRKANATVVVTF